MPHNNNTFCTPSLAVLLIQDRLRSNRIHVERRRILICMPDSRSVTAAGGRRQHATCAQYSSPDERYSTQLANPYGTYMGFANGIGMGPIWVFDI